MRQRQRLLVLHRLALIPHRAHDVVSTPPAGVETTGRPAPALAWPAPDVSGRPDSS
ncbi:hypothetical protein ACIGXI_33965 [Kitasatospora aureofaciens]|uniref:hypothetical protein n=1 Tax=Kitasatospora aureofaciens TaxID=1894 RepID=UPI0037C74CDF